MEARCLALIPFIVESSSTSSILLDEACKPLRMKSDVLIAAVCADQCQRSNNEVSSKAKIQEYIPEVVWTYDLETFRQHFRLQRATVQYLYELIGFELGDDHAVRPGRRRTSSERNVLLPIWTLSNQESFRGICDRFGLGVSHGYRLFKRFCTALTRRLRQFISWPQGQAMDRTLIGFETLRKYPFPGVVGCVDGTYIQIRGTRAENESYCTRKKFRAIILQGICDYQLRFIDVFVGWPGSSHDARVWRNSQVLANIHVNQEKYVPGDTHILGDSAYPLENFLMVPYKDNGYLTPRQKHFNRRLSSSRVVIENAFGHLKSRFRRLRFLDVIRMDLASSVITAACILHNICVDQGDEIDDFEPDRDLVEALGAPELHATGEEKRDRIANVLFESRAQ